MKINLANPTAVWLAVAPPNPNATVPPGLEDFANQILGWLKWGVLFSGVLGILVCAVMIIMPALSFGAGGRSAMAAHGVGGRRRARAGRTPS